MDTQQQRVRRSVFVIGAPWLFLLAFGCMAAQAHTNQVRPRVSSIPPPFVPIDPPRYSIHLAWDRSPDPVDGYRIHWGPAPGVYTNSATVGNTTNCTITNLLAGVYCFAATAYNSAGAESFPSNEIRVPIPYNPPFTNYVLLDWVERGPTNRLLSRTVLTNPPGNSSIIEALVTQTNDQVRVIKMGRVMSITNTNQ